LYTKPKPPFDSNQLVRKAESFCAFQERCTLEVRQFLSKLTDNRLVIQEITNHLLEEGFVNNQRFCNQFAGGKFRIKKWGRLKIRSVLFQKGLPEAMIEVAIDQEISAEDYLTTIRLLVEKYKELNKGCSFEQLVRYLQSKGYELPIVMDVLQSNG
jgi:regulatory protein